MFDLGLSNFRDLEKGTWFIECICRIFMEHACEDDLVSISFQHSVITFYEIFKVFGNF